jgi:hypothetical protein
MPFPLQLYVSIDASASAAVAAIAEWGPNIALT